MANTHEYLILMNTCFIPSPTTLSQKHNFLHNCKTIIKVQIFQLLRDSNLECC